MEKRMKIWKRNAGEHAEPGESGEQGPQCSKCGKNLASTDADGVCKHCAAAAQRRRAKIFGTVVAGSIVGKKYGPKVVSLAMKVIKK